MDHTLIGCWRVTGIDMIVGRSVQLIGGLPGEFVEFTADGQYRVDLADHDPGVSRYHASKTGDVAELDIWIEGLESLPAHCIYRITGDRLEICIAGNSRPRPTELRRNDTRLWCVTTFERAEPPRQRRSRRAKPLCEPGSLIPTSFLKSTRKKSRNSQ